ncbi:5'-deoxynucleotidase [Candidatus Colwellia aromaticivorans]|uniref:5'-deoxynucleotidase n=1 Tax=Candidatus Colwellia aromaticivorans TaxID=2267621 RepID=UPI000DF1B260|nr:5'-deoxynucleotidase [Candidatus Colwellia aromaticivorans]
MVKSTFLAWVIRMPLIKRWGLMHCVKKENIAEHSHQVAVIAHLLATIKNQYFGGSINAERAATVAIYHEISETKLQDINHVTKYHNPELTKEFKKLEEIAELECLRCLPKELQNEFKPLLVQSNVEPEYKKIVKAADIISAYLKASDELKFGNNEFTDVKPRLLEMLETYRKTMPEVNYLLDVFEENCFVSVDKLSNSDG